MDQTIITSFASGISSVTDIPIAAVTALLIASLIVWFCWRSKSIHPLSSRIWFWIAGKGQTADPQINERLQESLDLAQFHFHYKISARTLAHAKRLMTWWHRNDEAPRDIYACGSYFDLEQCELKRKKIGPVWSQVMTGVFSATFLFVAACFAGGAAMPFYVAKMRDSNVWFLLSSEAAKPLHHDRISAKDCSMDKAELAKKSGFTANETGWLCESFKKEAFATEIKDEVIKQRFAFAGLALLSFLIGIPSAFDYRRNRIARDMQTRLDKKAVTKANAATSENTISNPEHADCLAITEKPSNQSQAVASQSVSGSASITASSLEAQAS